MPIPLDYMDNLQIDWAGNEGHIITHSKNDFQEILSSARSFAAAGNFIMLGRGAVENLIGSAAQ